MDFAPSKASSLPRLFTSMAYGGGMWQRTQSLVPSWQVNARGKHLTRHTISAHTLILYFVSRHQFSSLFSVSFLSFPCPLLLSRIHSSSFTAHSHLLIIHLPPVESHSSLLLIHINLSAWLFSPELGHIPYLPQLASLFLTSPYLRPAST